MTNKHIDQEFTVDSLASILDSTIKYDKASKVILFLCMLSTYTKNNQLNTCLIGPSSSGKTFLAQEVAKFFPKEDLWFMASVTKKTFKYLAKNEDGILSFRNRIIVFQDAPSSEILKELRPVLSHDQDRLSFYSVNKDQNSRNATEKTIFEGAPAVVFCSANFQINDQEATRCLLLSPETSQDKVEAGIDSVIEKEIDSDAHQQGIEANTARQVLQERVEYISGLADDGWNIVIPSHEAQDIKRRFMAKRRVSSPRDMRAIGHIMSLIKTLALLNAPLREETEGKIVVDQYDIEQVFKLWDEIAESQKEGVTPAAIQFYHDVIVPAYHAQGNPNGGLSKKAIRKYCVEQGKTVSSHALTQIISSLIDQGFISYDKIEGIGNFKFVTPLRGVEPPKAERSATTHKQE